MTNELRIFVVSLASVLGIASGSTDTFAQGDIVLWGSAPGAVPLPNSGFVGIAAGGGHCLAMRSDGSLEAWGDNGEGQCDVPLPNSGYVAIAGGNFHSLGLRSDGSIAGWGADFYGQRTPPTPNAGFIGIEAGTIHSLGLRSNGSITAWGWYGYHETEVPAPNANFVASDGGSYMSLGLKSDGTVVPWGLPVGCDGTVPAPNADFVAVATGSSHNLGVKGDSSIVAWGYNGYGQCNVPAPNDGFVAVSAYGFVSVGLKANGTIVAWGDNSYGQCNVPPGGGFTAIACGGTFVMGLRNTVTGVTAPESTESLGHGSLTVDSAYPNPFSISSAIQFRLGQPDLVSLEVYDLAGRLVLKRTLGHRDAGMHEAEWDGRDADGKLMHSGVYFLRLRTSTIESPSVRVTLTR